MKNLVINCHPLSFLTKKIIYRKIKKLNKNENIKHL